MGKNLVQLSNMDAGACGCRFAASEQAVSKNKPIHNMQYYLLVPCTS